MGSFFRSAKRKAGSLEELWLCRCACKIVCLDGVGGAALAAAFVVGFAVAVMVVVVVVVVVVGDERECECKCECADGSVATVTGRYNY